MINLIKNYIKSKPYLYDSVNALRSIDSGLEHWIDNYSKSSSKPISFIQVGASDGLRWDPIRKYVIRDRWRGVFIEPLPPVFDLLKKNYGYLKRKELKFENVAISDESEIVQFWSCSKTFLKDIAVEDQLFHLRKSSLSREQFERSFGGGNDNVECYSVATSSLSDIINKHFPDSDIDLIFIDAEGYDDRVIRTINFDHSKPKTIVYENHNLVDRGKSTERYLTELGYTIQKMQDDTIATLNPSLNKH